MEKSLGGAGFASFCREALQIRKADVCSYSPLALAYIGDGVYELIIRTRIVGCGNVQVNKMHKRSAQLVRAQAQAELIKLLEEELTEEERAVYRRGRNARSATMAKHATMIDYRMATGFEALVGWLYLTDQYERLILLVSRGLQKIGELT